MTKEEFISEAICCPLCCGEPIIRHEIVEELFSDKPALERFICRCPMCYYMGLKTGYCKTPEGAVKSWNKKVISWEGQ